jgi:hypothetical protein
MTHLQTVKYYPNLRETGGTFDWTLFDDDRKLGCYTWIMFDVEAAIVEHKINRTKSMAQIMFD